MDIYETADAYIVTAELPGLTKKDVQIEFADGQLTLSGVRPERDGACEQYHRVERGHGSFSRTFQFALPVDGDGIAADLRHGVLTVTCPKTSDAGARRIQIS